MADLFLPRQRGLREPRTFWLLASAGSGLIAGLGLSTAAFPRAGSLGLAIAIFIGIPGLVWPRLPTGLARIWNSVASRYIRVARFWVLFVSFYLVVVPASRAGSTLLIRRPATGSSGWVPRPDPDVPESDLPSALDDQKLLAWIRRYVRWSVKTKNSWACALLPFLVILSFLDMAAEESVPDGIYTLF